MTSRSCVATEVASRLVPETDPRSGLMRLPELGSLGSHDEWWWPEDRDLGAWAAVLLKRSEWALLDGSAPFLVELELRGT